MDNKIKLYFVITLGIFCLFNCKRINNKENRKSEPENNEITYILSFPDTVIIGKTNKGLIEYSSVLDTVKLKEKDRRYILFYATGHKDSLNFQELMKKEHDTFVSIGEGKIPIYDLSFTEKGSNFLDGYIEDQVIIFDYEGNEEKSRIITKTSKVYKEVIVIDSLKTVTQEMPISKQNRI